MTLKLTRHASRKLLSAGLTALACSLGTTTSGLAQNETKPNIIYIVADDLGWKDVGFHGSDIKTPNLDLLARDGVRLEQFYAQPMCTPTRAAFLTGRYPFRYGLQTMVIPASMTYGLPTDERLLPQTLKEVGYNTAILGKWHLGHAKTEFWPMQRGFDYQYGALIGEIDYYTHSAGGKTDWFRNNKPVNEKGYVTTLLGDDAVKYVERQDKARPVFMYLAFTAPHAPFQAPEKYLDQYKGMSDKNRQAYAAMVTAMDDQIGRVVHALETRGVRDNTLIVFQSDNGGNHNPHLGEVAVQGSLPASNGPYRGGKGDLYEGGTRVVALANWPGHIKSGTVEGMMHVVDMYPTLAGLAGADTKKGKPLDGMDMWRSISTGAASLRNEVVYNIELFRGGLREGDWKLVWQTVLPSKVELFDLASDPYEKNNVAAEHEDKVRTLEKKIDFYASGMSKSLLLQQLFKTISTNVTGKPPAFPSEAEFFEQGD
jgi:arylsulfatase B